MTYHVNMEKVNVSTLKTHLSEILRSVKRGGEFLVMDRRDPVARLSQVPASVTDSENGPDLFQKLFEEGLLDLPSHPKIKGAWLKKNLIRARGSAVKSLLAEREEAAF